MDVRNDYFSVTVFKMIFSHFHSILVVLIGSVESYDMPVCEKGADNVCYKDDTDQRECNGYVDFARNVKKPENVMEWKKSGKIEYLIVQDKFTYMEAKEFCKAICSKLYTPIGYATTYDSISNDFWYHSLGPFYVGLEIKVSQDEQITIFSTYDNSTALPMTEYNNFMDTFFKTALGFKGPGTFPLLIRTSTNRFNTFENANYDEKHAFACEGVLNDNEVSGTHHNQGKTL